MKLPLFLQPRDTYERHWVAARELRRAGVRSVLDVGGEGLLGRFLPGATCVSANTNPPTDVLYDGAVLPFPDGAFEAAVSLDTLEHVPPADRQAFCGELLRVARRLVVLAAPYGSELHSRLELQALEAYRQARGRDHEYLRQHVDNGLPTEQEVRDLLRGTTLRLAYSGDCAAEYERFVRNLKRESGRREGSSLAGTFVSILRNAHLRRRYPLADVAAETTNRMYIFVALGNHAGMGK